MTVVIEPRDRAWRLTARMTLPHPIGQVFEFFSDAANLEAITPGRLRFEIRTPLPIEMRVGALIDYKLRIRGLPVLWQTEITTWDPPHRFVDEQRRGPYRRWHHEHRFTAVPGGTLVEDIVDYDAPGGWLSNALFIKRDLRHIFEHRQRALEEHFEVMTPAPGEIILPR